MEFAELLPEVIFNCVEDQGYQPTGALTPLNSYENRVYLIPLEGAEPLVAKFYRPGRWSGEAIADEHRFLFELTSSEIPVVAPLPLKKHCKFCDSLGVNEGLFYALFPRFRGKEKDEILNEDRKWMGRLLARLHNVGEKFRAPSRLKLNAHTFGYESLEFILSQQFLPSDLAHSIERLLHHTLSLIEPYFNESLPVFPIHGDCHPGNILWNKDGPHLVDFDDMVIGPAVQDLWMLFYGSAAEIAEQKKFFFEGYEVFRDFDESTFILTEPLRTLRMIRHAAWIGQRYTEPAFQRAFPYYKERRYWEQFLLSMKEQISLLQEL